MYVLSRCLALLLLHNANDLLLSRMLKRVIVARRGFCRFCYIQSIRLHVYAFRLCLIMLFNFFVWLHITPKMVSGILWSWLHLLRSMLVSTDLLFFLQQRRQKITQQAKYSALRMIKEMPTQFCPSILITVPTMKSKCWWISSNLNWRCLSTIYTKYSKLKFIMIDFGAMQNPLSKQGIIDMRWKMRWTHIICLMNNNSNKKHIDTENVV